MTTPENPSPRSLLIAGGITALMIAGSWWAATHEGAAPASNAEPESTPTPAFNADGSVLREIEGQTWRCLPMNDPEYMRTFDPGKPTVVVPLDAMRFMDDTTPPFLIIRGSDGPMKVHRTFSKEFKSMANGAETCVDGK